MQGPCDPSTANLFWDAAAYDPVADSWRNLTPAPARGTNRDAVLAGRTAYFAFEKGPFNPARLAAYDVDGDAWRLISAPPGASQWRLVAVGEHLVAVAQALRGKGSPYVRYDPAKDTWRALPGDPLGRVHWRDSVSDGSAGLYVVAQPGTGSTNRRGPARAAVLDLPSGRWTRLPDLPVGANHPRYWVGGRLAGPSTLQSDRARTPVYDPDARRWSTVSPPGPATGRWSCRR